jgi:DNA repair protein RadA/Sms
VPIGQVRVEESAFRPAACPSSTGCSAAGWCPGAAILLAGEPGRRQEHAAARGGRADRAHRARTLYVTGEESASQVRLRADRTGGVHDELFLAAETDLGAVLTHIEQVRPTLLVVDSIQTIGASGSTACPAASPRSRRSRPP